MAASRKQAKCAALSGSYVFEPITLETLGPINESALKFLNNLGHKITSVSTDDKEGQFLFQRLSVALQRFNAILLHESFGSDDDRTFSRPAFLICFAFNPRDLYYRGYKNIKKQALGGRPPQYVPAPLIPLWAPKRLAPLSRPRLTAT